MSESEPESQEIKIDKDRLGEKFLEILTERVDGYKDLSEIVSQRTREELFLDDRMGLDVLVETVQEILKVERFPPAIEKALRSAMMEAQFADPVSTMAQLSTIKKAVGENPEDFLKNKTRIYVNSLRDLTLALQHILPEDLSLEIEKRKDDWVAKFLGTDINTYLES